MMPGKTYQHWTAAGWRSSRIWRLVVAAIVAAGCSSDSGLRPFTSDGCSLFPDSDLISSDDWCTCCFEHDIAYWKGGTAEEREEADARLRECVLERTENQALADLMYVGVRAGGSPYFYNWYRWGYGWEYDRKYQALTPAEEALADELLGEATSVDAAAACSEQTGVQ